MCRGVHAIKEMPGTKDYPDRSKKLGLPTPAYRIVRGDVIKTYNILYGVYDREVADVLTFYKDSAGMDSMLMYEGSYSLK